jgi:hypothetical protein
MTMPSAVCREERRREDVRKATLLGIDFVEVDPAAVPPQTVLQVFFLGKMPDDVQPPNVTIAGGSPVRVKSVHYPAGKGDATLDDWMEVTVDRPGDFSTYTLALVKLDDQGRPTTTPMDGLDARYATVTFSFKASCPSDMDCCAPDVCPPPVRVQPAIDYLAKDYASFRQLIFDRLAQTMPNWRETHAADIGVMLVELLAYAGDQLSYYQDAVATEAYLGTARQRISVRRHARLVDYVLHEGCNARAWLTIATNADTKLDPANVFFCTPFANAPAGHVLQPDDFAKAPPGSCEIFEPLVADPSQPIVLRAAHSTIDFYTWGDCACCLPKGTTRATLADAWVAQPGGLNTRALALAPNDVLILEEVIGPGTGNAADADPAHRQAIRITKVTPGIDALYDTDKGGRPVVEIEWCSEDALTFPLCISARMPAPDCTCRDKLSVARGNVILVDSGATITEPLGTVTTASSTERCATDCEGAGVVLTPGRFRPALQQTPLTFGQDLPPCGCASTVFPQDPRRALPRVVLTGTLDAPAGPVATTWTARPDLLGSEGSDTVFVAEIDDDARAHLRFGTGGEGRVPDAGTSFTARYRVGNGPAGNVGAETIAYVVFRSLTVGSGDLVPRNPIPASGGTAPEPVAEARMFAPYAFRDVIERAITSDDYALLAADDTRRLGARSSLVARPSAIPYVPQVFTPPLDDARAGEEEEPGEADALPPDLCLLPFRRLQNAKAALRWTGSWYEAQVALDPLGSESVDDELTAEIAAYLEPYRRVGHDIGVRAARYVPLDLGLSVCVAPGYLRGHVEAMVLAVLGTGVLPNGALGMFHPDRLTFGQGIPVSPIVAAVQAVAGVMEVQLTRLARYAIGAPAPRANGNDLPRNGVLAMGAFEIARLDNDPNAPANGRLTMIARGGR